MTTDFISSPDAAIELDPMTALDAHHGFHTKPDLICLSHLRWDFVHQRPQHLLKRAARDRRVFFIEEAVFDSGPMYLETVDRENGIKRIVPHLPHGLHSSVASSAMLMDMMHRLIRKFAIRQYVLWYYTPMALPFTAQLDPSAVVYDCMDELSAFKGAPPNIQELERSLFEKADVVFTGGQSLYEAKRNQHRAVHAFPSSIDLQHFLTARTSVEDPEDQRDIPHPRLGFFGVVDERFDINLLDGVAKARPDWHFVILGPVVKIDPADLPKHANIHYLGAKSYQDLPYYIASWDVALLLFARNEATRFISPTKTPEYLAAGKQVVSTSIRDVVRPYGDMGLVKIADTPDEFIRAIETCLKEGNDNPERLSRVDKFLAGNSWDQTWSRMSQLIDEAIATKRSSRIAQKGTAATVALNW